MKTIEEIKIEAFKEFLKRLATHEVSECLDIIPTNGFTM